LDAAIRFKSTGAFKRVCSTQLIASAVASLAGPNGEIRVDGVLFSASVSQDFNIAKSAEEGRVAELFVKSGNSISDFNNASDVFERTAAAVARDGHYRTIKKNTGRIE
jgi:hypothetical protein